MSLLDREPNRRRPFKLTLCCADDTNHTAVQRYVGRKHNDITPGKTTKYCNQRVPVCLYVCRLAHLKTKIQISQNYPYTLPVTLVRSSSDDNDNCAIL